MDDKTKEYLPAEAKNLPALLSRLSDIAIPPQFRGTTDVAEVQRARRAYEAQYSGDTYSELQEKYSRCIDRIMNERLENFRNQNDKGNAEPAKEKDPGALLEQKRNIQPLLERNSVERYRQDAKLDILREGLKKMLFGIVSFERGLSNLLEYRENNKGNVPLKPVMTPQGIENLKLPPEVKALNAVYPNLTADEVSWISLAKLPENWLYNSPAAVYYPHALADIDMDGLMFAMGTIDDRLENSVEAAHSLSVGGITGASPQYQLVRFSHNVSQLIRAIVLLSIDDTDLFSGLWAGQDISAMQRGDSMLLKSFLKNRPEQYKLPEGFDSGTIESFVSDKKLTENDIDACRDAITRYYSGIQMKGMPLHWVLDFAKLMGMLSRLPDFVAKEGMFRGYAKLYGTGIDFISDEGKVVDSVPLAEHLQHRASYAFQGRISDTSKKNKVMQELLDGLQARISEANSGKNQLAMDAVQSEIFEKHGIFVPASVHSEDLKYTPEELYLAHSTDDTLVERTVKFSHDEMCMIRDVLDDLPKGAAKGVRSIFKELSDAKTVDAFRTGRIRGGKYDPIKRRIMISLPIESPLMCSGEEVLMAKIAENTEKKSKALQEMKKVMFHKAYFRHVFLHETGEAIFHSMPDKAKNEWNAISSSAKEGEDRKNFLTPYSKESQSEDFCECFAIYYLRGGEFRRRAADAPALKAKYDFMKRIWSADKPREFADKGAISLSELHGRPEDDMESLTLAEMIAEVLRADSAAMLERAFFEDTALSFEQLAEDAEKDDVSTFGELEKTARKHAASGSGEALEESLRTERIRDFVHAKTEQAVYRLKADAAMVFDGGLEKFLYNGQRNEAVGLLITHGAKKRRAENAVEDLMKLYRYFDEHLCIQEITPEEARQAGDRAVNFAKGIMDWKKQKANRRPELPPEEEGN